MPRNNRIRFNAFSNRLAAASRNFAVLRILSKFLPALWKKISSISLAAVGQAPGQSTGGEFHEENDCLAVSIRVDDGCSSSVPRFKRNALGVGS
jgi:hypothetical protein